MLIPKTQELADLEHITQSYDVFTGFQTSGKSRPAVSDVALSEQIFFLQIRFFVKF